MNRLATFPLALAVLVLAFGVYISTFKIELYGSYEQRKHPIFHDYKGVTHVVTKKTRGSLSASEILQSAQKAGLDFLFYTDLNDFKDKESLNGYHGDVLTFTFPKVSFSDNHIVIASESGGSRFKQLLQWQNQLDMLAEAKPQASFSDYKDLFFILAHPFKRNMTWNPKLLNFVNGIEVVNLRKLWQEIWYNNPLHFFHSALVYPFNPDLALARLVLKEKMEFELWDQVNKRRPLVGLLGNQTTSRIFSLFGNDFSFPSYRESFQFASNHILLKSELTGNEESDRKKIFSALKKGQSYFSFDALGSPKGFAAYIKQKGRTELPGSQLPLRRKMTLHVDLPKGLVAPVEVHLLKDSTLVDLSKKSQSDFEINASGSYRIEVYVQPKFPFPERARWVPWIFTNPFFIK